MCPVTLASTLRSVSNFWNGRVCIVAVFKDAPCITVDVDSKTEKECEEKKEREKMRKGGDISLASCLRDYCNEQSIKRRCPRCKKERDVSDEVPHLEMSTGGSILRSQAKLTSSVHVIFEKS